jgi:hypothetical protein
MQKLVLINLIPIFSFIEVLLEYKRVLPVKYRLLMYEYGYWLLLIQLMVLIITLALWKRNKYRIISISIFLLYLVVSVFGFMFVPPVDLFD